MSLADLYAVMESQDYEMQKEASEMEKLAAEEDAAGRITARGFMDELNKLAEGMALPPASQPAKKPAPPVQKTPGQQGAAAGKAAAGWMKNLPMPK